MRKYDRSIPSKYDDYIKETATSVGVDPEVLRKILWIESNFNPEAKSPTGPVGIAQMTKATGRAMGLRIDNEVDERLDPYKSIDAAARHLKDLDKEAKGDINKLGLLYNQGQGKLGRPQIEAYNRGAHSKISKEGLKYMELLGNYKPSNTQGSGLDALQAGSSSPKGGITPTAKPVDFENMPTSSDFQVSAPDVSLSGLSSLYKEPPPDYFLYGEEKDPSLFEGTGQAIKSSLKNSVAGQMYQSFTSDDYSPASFFNNTYELDDEDWGKVLASNLDVSYVPILQRAFGKEDFDGLLRQALENQAEDNKLMETGMGAQVLGGLSGAVVDLLTYVPMGGVTGKGVSMLSKMLSVGTQTGVASAASELVRTHFAGGIAHYDSAFLGGMIFGSGISALSHVFGNYKGIDRSVDSTYARAEARQKALETGEDDLTRFDTSTLDFKDLKFVPHPEEQGAVVLRDGSVLSAGNPLNPETINKFNDVNPMKANKGFNWGSLSEIGQVMNESSNEAVRAIGNKFTRPPTGFREGAYQGMTVSDILARMRAQNNVDFEKVQPLLMKAIDLETSMVKGITKDEAIQRITRRIGEHMETGKGTLSELEAQLKEPMQDFFKRKEGYLKNTSQFGNANAKPLLKSSRYEQGNYFPNVYDRGSLNKWRNLLGQDGLQNAIAKSWLLSDEKFITNAKAYLKEIGHIQEGMPEAQINEILQDYAMRKAYGISHSDSFVASSKVDEVKDGLVGVENNNYLEARHLFDSSVKIQVEGLDGKLYDFSPNDLRNWDMMTIMGNYALRVDGDISIMGALGKSTRELKDEITALRMQARSQDKAKTLREVEALEQGVLLATGRSRLTPEGIAGETLNSLNDLALLGKGFYIPLLNFTEASSMFSMGNLGAIYRNFPILKEFSSVNKRLSPEQIKEINRAVFGKELSDVYRATKANHIDRIYSSTESETKAKIMGNIRYATQEMTNRAPWVKWIPQTTNLIIDTAREGFLGDIAGDIIGATNKATKWDNKKWLKAAGLSDEQWQGAKNLLREHLEVGPDGRYHFKDLEGLQADPRTYDLWRYGDFIGRETILQPHRLDNQTVKQLGALGRTALMFKNFVMRSMNARTLNNFYQATRNGRGIEKSFELAISMGLATLGFVMRAQLVAMAMSDSDREAYLNKAFSPEVLAYNALTRSSVLGGFGVFNNIAGAMGWDTAQMVRSSLYARPPLDKVHPEATTGRDVMHGLAQSVAEQIPALDLVSNVAASGKNIFDALNSENYIDRTKNVSMFTQNLNRVVPNVPFLQQALIQLWEANGVPTDSR